MSNHSDFVFQPVEIGNVSFRNPLYIASGPTTRTIKQVMRAEECGWGGVSLKLSIAPEPYINREPRYGWFADQGIFAFTAEKRLLQDECLELIQESRKQTSDLVIMANIAYADYREMFEKEDLDLISVCVPNYLHREVVIAAAEAGLKAIICEKPLATSIEDGLEMVKVFREKKVKLMYAEDWIFAPALTRAKEIIQEGGIGDILYVKAKETHNGSHSVFAQQKKYCGGGAMIHRPLTEPADWTGS